MGQGQELHSEYKLGHHGQDLVQKVVDLQQTVQKTFRILAVFFFFTFLFFSIEKVHQHRGSRQELYIELLLRFMFFVIAGVLGKWASSRINREFLKYVASVQESENQLRFREQSKALLLSNLSEGILEYDVTSRQWVTVTSQFLNIFRMDWFKFMRENKEGQSIHSWYSLLHPQDLTLAKSLIDRRLKTTGVDRCQMRMVNDQNETRTIDIGISSIIESDNRGVLIISHRDITDIIKVENQKQLLTSIVEQSPDSYLICDGNGTALYTSPSAKGMLQKAKENECHDFDFLTDPESLKSQLLINLNPGGTYKRILQPHCKSASMPKFILLSAFSVDEKGSDDYYVVIIKDISDAYQREMEVQKLKDRMELALHAANIGVWEWDLSSQQVSWDANLYHLFELNPQSKPTFEYWISKIHPEDASMVRMKLSEVLEKKHDFDLQFRIKALNGQIMHIKGMGKVMKSYGNETGEKMFGIFWDITKEMATEAALEQSRIRQQSSARLAALGEMASGVAHEINNPLSVISARATLLRMKLKSGDTSASVVDYQSALESIEKNVDRISKIVKGLRTFSRDGEKDPFQRHDLGSLIEDTLGVCSERFRRNGVTLVINNRCPQGRSITCRGVQIAQVMVNLINNAFDAAVTSHDKRVTLDIFDDQDGTVHFQVSDTGKGVPANLEEKIMQPFFTTKEVGKGTGLGLSISQAIIRDHKGRLFLDRNIADSCFHFTIPVLQDAAQAYAQDRSTPSN